VRVKRSRSTSKSRDKQLRRKLQELAITFLLESALGKDRIIEIYLNIIEWGPDLRGLRPAVRRYFGRQAREPTPAEMAFLVTIIPGPIKYQSSFAPAAPGPGPAFAHRRSACEATVGG
jgi:membrane peptidoglycan carboxypeptidase